MTPAIFHYLKATTILVIQKWSGFWFASRSTFDPGIARVAMGLLAAVYAASWFFDLHHWINTDGRLNASVTRFLIGDQVEGTGSMGRVSLLYQIESKWWVQSYLIVTSLCSLAMALGLGGRVSVALAWILTLGIVHRVPMLQGAGDLLFTGMMGYLVIDPGKTKYKWSFGFDDGTDRWTSNLAIRLMQCHLLVWLVVSFLSHLAEPMWWTGSAAWWLASARQSPWFSQFLMSDKPYLVNALSHGFLLLHFAAIGLLIVRHCRPLGIATLCSMAMAIWGLAGDWFYSIALVACSSCFWGIAARELQLANLARPRISTRNHSDHQAPANAKSKSTSSRPVHR